MLVCDDGSGEIFIDIKVRIFNSAPESYSNWVIKEGTDDYTHLFGEGKIVATGTGDPNLIHDHYTGLMHQE
jgi:hypothetical protein